MRYLNIVEFQTEINEVEKFLDGVKSKNMSGGAVIFYGRFGRHHCRKESNLIIIYIIIDVFLGREFKKGEIVLRFSLVLAMKIVKRIFYIY